MAISPKEDSSKNLPPPTLNSNISTSEAPEMAEALGAQEVEEGQAQAQAQASIFINPIASHQAVIDSSDQGEHVLNDKIEEPRNGGPNPTKLHEARNEFPFQEIGEGSNPRLEDGTQSEVMLGAAVATKEDEPGKRFEAIKSESTRISDTLAVPSININHNHNQDQEDLEIPPGRRSVQFARPQVESPSNEVALLQRSEMVNPEGESTIKDRRGVSLLSRLKALASTSTSVSHVRSPSDYTAGTDSADDRIAHTVSTPPFEARRGGDVQGGNSETDADGEESTGEELTNSTRSRRKSRHSVNDKPRTVPVTPRTPFLRGGKSPFGLSGIGDSPSRPSFLRRATVAGVEREGRQGVSEDEGRDRLAGSSRPWTRANTLRGLSYGGLRKANNEQGIDTEPARPSPFKRALTSFATSAEGPDPSTSPWKFRTDRTASLSAAKWRQIKAGLRMIGRTSKEKNKIDHAKSAELLAELTAGAPAALLLASTFQRDEHGNRRIPVLLEQLKVKVTDSKQVDSKSGDRHMVFRIELEYGNGLTRMKWVIHRALRDFANLHARYKLQIGAQKYIKLKDHDARTKLPHFPKSTFPYLRGIRGLESESEGEEEADRELTAPSGAESGTDRPGKRKRRSSMTMMRRKSSMVDATGANQIQAAARKDIYAERQRKKLETYLQQMIRYLIFRPESNRLCKFLEISALGVRLASEGSYHGKEGHLIIQSANGVDFRRALHPSLFKARHGMKWFLVRHSYIVCVDSPEEMNIYDVFLVDSDFKVQAKKNTVAIRDQSAKDLARAAKHSAAYPQHHALKIYNSERKLRLLAKNERQLHQFEDSIRFMVSQTPWALKNRFDSFAPERPKVFAQWLVDGRDYMWNVSRAISMAKDVICIHDWWLSPEIYMRRPAAISQKWRLDRLLQRKAEEGVKIFVIMYRNINSAVPIDSEYSKFSLLDLHPNIFVQRSPNQMRQGTFFWAHHEKICVIDHIIAFVGGIDLCFGRWDTPQHELADDKPTGFEDTEFPKDADHCQLWPGKDYSNPRVQDFHALDKPYEEMYDRTKVPRMPWHDISMQVVGQPARDLTRHFVQRWNYILRQRKPTRPTPFLIPPPDFVSGELKALGLEGTCEVQILRSACMWSLGTPDRIEHSIMNAYAKTIQQSDHLVYIENQFFVSSSETEGTRIENTVGDALVERIIRAHRNGESWRAIIIIPLMPGFQNTVDAQDGTSIRLIMQCQYRSICRGDSSLFSRLRAEGIEPEDYIVFYSLRTWGKLGPSQQLVTEQLYIHAKCMVVDDRVAIIGSANINERSLIGNRDSECAAVVRDTDMIWSVMADRPYLVGRFAHSLRMRLMREHLGIDVDGVDHQHFHEAETDGQWEQDMDAFHGEPPGEPLSEADNESEDPDLQETYQVQDDFIAKSEALASFNHDVDWEQGANPNIVTNKKYTSDPRIIGNEEHRKDVGGDGVDQMNAFNLIKQQHEHASLISGPQKPKLRTDFTKSDPQLLSPQSIKPIRLPASSSPSTLISAATSMRSESRSPQVHAQPDDSLSKVPGPKDGDTEGSALRRILASKLAPIIDPAILGMKQPDIEVDCMRDPLNDAFFLEKWHTVAKNNTRIYRQVFRSMPDSEVKTWKEYKEYIAFAERFAQAQSAGKSKERIQAEKQLAASGPPGSSGLSDKLRTLGPVGEVLHQATDSVHDISTKIPEARHIGPLETKSDVIKEENFVGEVQRAAGDANTANSRDTSKPKPKVEVLDEKAAYQKDPQDANAVPAPPPTTSPAIEKQTKLSTEAGRDSGSQRKRRRTTTRASKREFRSSDEMLDKETAADVLSLTQGHLVLWPYDWLAKEQEGGNWLYSIDQLAPLEIYN